MISSIKMPQPLSILGVTVTPFESYHQAVRIIEDRIIAGQRSFCVAINPEKVYRAQQEPELRAILSHTGMGICDGVGICLAARLLHRIRIRRCTGVDLFYHLIERAAQAEWRIFLLGASEQSNEAAARILAEKYPGLCIAGRQNGYFDDSNLVVRRINDSGAQVLFVAMGSPRQEFWIADHYEQLTAAFCMGVGGTLDVVSGAVKRAPLLFRKTGTEFLYRLAKNPNRWRRQSVLPLFLLNVMRQVVFPKKYDIQPESKSPEPPVRDRLTCMPREVNDVESK